MQHRIPARLRRRGMFRAGIAVGVLTLAAGTRAKAQTPAELNEVDATYAIASGRIDSTPSAAFAPAKRKGHRHNDHGKTVASGKAYLGELTQDFSMYDATSFTNELKGAGWYGWEWNRKCIDGPSCANEALGGTMLAQAIGDANMVPAGRKLNGHAVVIGRVINTGTVTDATTQLPAEKHPSEYYYIIRRNASNTRTDLYVAQLTRNQSTGDYDTGVTFYTTPADAFQSCAPHPSPGNPHTPRQFALGSFGSCKTNALNDDESDTEAIDDNNGLEPVSVSKREQRQPSKRRPSRPLFGDSPSDAAAWFSCADGCCIAQAPPFSMLKKFVLTFKATAPRAKKLKSMR